MMSFICIFSLFFFLDHSSQKCLFCLFKEINYWFCWSFYWIFLFRWIPFCLSFLSFYCFEVYRFCFNFLDYTFRLLICPAGICLPAELSWTTLAFRELWEEEDGCGGPGSSGPSTQSRTQRPNLGSLLLSLQIVVNWLKK